MKFIVLLCNVLFLATCFGVDERVLSTSAEEREAEFRFITRKCARNDNMSFLQVVDVGNYCVNVEISRALSTARTIEEFREFFKKSCQTQSIVRRCLADITTYIMETCQNEIFLNIFKIYRETIETILDFGCGDDGAKLATFSYGMFDLASSELVTQAQKCANRCVLIVTDLERSKIDISSKLYILHAEIIAFSECLYQIKLEQSFKDAFKSFFGEIINNMKCILPQDGALVPCGTIDVSLVSTPNVCDLKTFGTEMSLYDVLEEDSGPCLLDFLVHADDTEDNDRVRQGVRLGCRYGLDLPYCYNNSRIVSEVCLNDTQQNEFKFLGDFMKSALEVACAKDRKRLSDIMVEVYRLKRNSAENGHAIWDCVDVAKSTRKQIDAHRTSSKNMRFYHELEAFKGCLVSKLVGDQTSVDAATSLIGEMLGMVKCVHPEKGTTVLCETLVRQLSTP